MQPLSAYPRGLVLKLRAFVDAIRRFPQRLVIIGQDPEQLPSMENTDNHEVYLTLIARLIRYLARRGVPAIHGKHFWSVVDAAAGGLRV